MTRAEAIKQIESLFEHCKAMMTSDEPVWSQDCEALKVALFALRGPTREQVEKVWRGGWEPGNPICPICGKDKFDGLDADIWADWMPNFCPHCGAPMTDKAVDMVMERLEALNADTGSV